MAAAESSGCVKSVLQILSRKLEEKTSAGVKGCMLSALTEAGDIPKYTYRSFVLLGQSLGRFDLDGQLKSMAEVRQECRRKLEELTINKEVRLRSYQTLGLCTGAALAILLI